MTTMRVGAHAPNYDTLTDADYHRLLLLRATVVGTLWTGGTRHKAEVYRKVDQVCPGCHFIIRVGPSGRTTAEQWMRDAKDAVHQALEAGIPMERLFLRVLNEVNLKDEGQWTPDEYVALLREIRARFAAAPPLVSSPLSMGVTQDSHIGLAWQPWFARFVEAGGLDLVDRVAVNVYPDAGQPLAPFLAAGKPIDVTEYGMLSVPHGQRGSAYADHAHALALHGAQTLQFFILNGKSHGAWDERYCLTDDEARIVGERWGGHVERPPAAPNRPESSPEPAIPPEPTEEAPVPERIYGVDISNHQGSVDWDALAASGRRFAFIKASECPSYRDPWLGRNWSEAKRVGLKRGAYCFARPSAATPAQSVELFRDTLANAGGLDQGDMIVLDIEDERVADGTNLLPWVKEWLERAEQTFGVRPLVYSAHWYLAPHGLEVPEMAGYALWAAEYDDTAPPVPHGWDRVHVWQFTAHGTVPGVRGDCDENALLCSWEEFVALGKGAAAVTEPGPFDYESDFWGPVYRAAQHLKQTGIPRDTAAAIAVEHVALLHKEKAA